MWGGTRLLGVAHLDLAGATRILSIEIAVGSAEPRPAGTPRPAIPCPPAGIRLPGAEHLDG